ncbi:MAG: ParB N-terminal domain-containing protein [Leifsonia sp.]
MARTATTKKTAAAVVDAPDLAAALGAGTVTIEAIDPATAQLDPNVRSNPEYTTDLLESIKAEGVREPVLARRGEDGTVYVWDGQRRLLAAREANVTAMLAVFGLTTDTGTTGDRLLDQLRTFNRSDLSLADRITAYEQLAFEGISVEKIARAAGAKKDDVHASIIVAKSAAAREVAKDYGRVSLDRLLLVAEFDGDDAAIAAIIDCEDDDDLAFVAQEIRDNKATAEAEAKLIEDYKAKGYQVHTAWGGFSYIDALTDAAEDADERPPLTADTHTECEGRAIYLSVYGTGEDDYRAGEVCNHADLHKPRYNGGRVHVTHLSAAVSDESDEDREARIAAEDEAKREERRRVLKNNKAWRTANTVRIQWVTNFLARKTLPKDTTAFVALSLTTHAQTLTDYKAGEHVATFLGQKANHYGRSEAAKLVEATPTKATHVSLAVVLSAREAHAEDVNGWRNILQTVSSYLLALETWGYKLSPVERIAAGYPEPTDDTAEAETDTATAESDTDAE